MEAEERSRAVRHIYLDMAHHVRKELGLEPEGKDAADIAAVGSLQRRKQVASEFSSSVAIPRIPWRCYTAHPFVLPTSFSLLCAYHCTLPLQRALTLNTKDELF